MLDWIQVFLVVAILHWTAHVWKLTLDARLELEIKKLEVKKKELEIWGYSPSQSIEDKSRSD